MIKFVKKWWLALVLVGLILFLVWPVDLSPDFFIANLRSKLSTHQTLVAGCLAVIAGYYAYSGARIQIQSQEQARRQDAAERSASVAAAIGQYGSDAAFTVVMRARTLLGSLNAYELDAPVTMSSKEVVTYNLNAAESACKESTEALKWARSQLILINAESQWNISSPLGWLYVDTLNMQLFLAEVREDLAENRKMSHSAMSGCQGHIKKLQATSNLCASISRAHGDFKSPIVVDANEERLALDKKRGRVPEVDPGHT